jgi:adenylosuccinate synthase
VPATCVIGLQWGDEAKGKVVDLLTEQHDVVVRYQGGANAGHTVVTGGQTYKLSLIPSGIFRPQVQCVVAGGVVLNPASLLEEVDGLTARGVKVGENLMLSGRAHVIFPWHFEEDRLIDQQCTGGEAIGTTMRGIGPCYRDKVGRSFAVRLDDMYRENFRDRIERITAAKTQILAGLGGTGVPLDAEEIFRQYDGYARRLKPHVADTTAYLLDAVEAGKRVLFEGAQGALLDVDHGTFPFVTSSNSSGVGVPSGSGVPGRYVTKVIGIVKAYTTRVGGGPFPTEQDNQTGQHIRDRGNEYGTVTRRPRRCGWFDAVAARYTARLSGVDLLAVMLLDVPSLLAELKICVAYELDGRRTTDFPSHVDDLRRVVPVYETLPGWQEEISHVRRLEDLPENARRYLDRISQLLACPVGIVSVGPDREQTMFAQV